MVEEPKKEKWSKTDIKYCPRCRKKNSIVVTINEIIGDYKCINCGIYQNPKIFYDELNKFCINNRKELMSERNKEKIVSGFRYSIDRNLRNRMLICGEKPIFISDILEVKCPQCNSIMEVNEYGYRGGVLCGETLQINCRKCHFDLGLLSEHVIINPDNSKEPCDVEELKEHPNIWPFRWAGSSTYG